MFMTRRIDQTIGASKKRKFELGETKSAKPDRFSNLLRVSFHISVSLAISLIAFSTSSQASIIETRVESPHGDGYTRRYRMGESVWNDAGFQEDDGLNQVEWFSRDNIFGTGWDSEDKDAYMQFPLDELEGSPEIIESTLFIHVTDFSGDGYNLYHREEHDATGNASDEIQGDTLVSALEDLDEDEWFAIDVTDHIESDVYTHGNDWAVFHIPNEQNEGELYFSSSSDQDNAPYLSTVIPEPSTFILIGVAGLLIVRKRMLSNAT